jgi:diguanylate cyclase (GGDEF)-like protein
LGHCFFIDLDNFKLLNDTLGHKMGDHLLAAAARRIAECMRDCDTVARLGGDEFIVLVEDICEQMQEAVAKVEAIGEKLLAALAVPYDLEGAVHHATASLGLTLFSDTDSAAEELMKQADIAMYHAKSAGRNKLIFFDPQMQAAIASRAELEDALRKGIERAEFLPYFQPIFHAARGIVGAETLLRWNRHGHGLVEPSGFIALAEETGLILPIWNIVLETVCRLLAIWNGTPLLGEIYLSVNVGVQEFLAQDFVARVGKALAVAGAPASRLTLELSESLVIRDDCDTIAKMKALKDLGVRISLDDFGTGYSSLAYLARLPLDEMKIDQSFVFNLPGSPADAAVVQSILTLCNSLNLSVVAEGVETVEQFAFLKEHGCQVCQGYLLGRPMVIEQLVQRVSSRVTYPL